MRPYKLKVLAALGLVAAIAVCAGLLRSRHRALEPKSLGEHDAAATGASPHARNSTTPTMLPPSAAMAGAAALQPVETLETVLSRHHILAEKALPLGAEREQLEKLLGDPANVALVRDRLLAVASAHFDSVEQDQRLLAVRFMRDALRFRANPAHSDVISAIRQIVLSENHRDASELKVKRSMAGDKVELFIALSTLEQDAAHELEAAGAQAANQRLIAYAARLATPPTRVR